MLKLIKTLNLLDHIYLVFILIVLFLILWIFAQIKGIQATNIDNLLDKLIIGFFTLLTSKGINKIATNIEGQPTVNTEETPKP